MSSTPVTPLRRPAATPPAACPARLNITVRVKVSCAHEPHADRPRQRHVAILGGDAFVSWLTDEHGDPIDVRRPTSADLAA